MSNPITIDGTNKDLPSGESDAIKVVSYNSVLAALQAPWTSYIPTLTNIAIGTGGAAELSCKYRQIGKLVFFKITIVMGSGGGAAVSGDVQFTLPVTAKDAGGALMPIGGAVAYDLSATTGYPSQLGQVSTTVARILVHNASGTYLTRAVTSSTIPFTWAAGDGIYGEGFYEAA